MLDSTPESAPSGRLNEILKTIGRLRPLPTSATRILNALDDPKTNASLISDLVALDQALTAYVLRVANSAGLGYALACSSIKDAVMRLGFKQVRSLVLSTIASGPLSSRLAGYRLGAKELWYHSVATASAAHWLAGVLRYPDTEKAYVAGLLHDIGKLTLDQFVLADYNQIIEIMRSRELPMWQVEEQLFGIDHAAVGGLVGTQWQFPEELVAAIRYHHNPSLHRPQQRLAAIVNLANALIPQEDSGRSEVLEGRVIHPEALEVLKLTDVMIEPLRERLKNALFIYESRMEML
jgi:putative nucleotidyltransferase with HDIG domain